MTPNLSQVNQIIEILISALILQGIGGFLAFISFKSKIEEWRKSLEVKHEENKERFNMIDTKFDKILDGKYVKTEDNDSDKDKIWNKLGNHETRISKTEGILNKRRIE